MTDTAPTNSPSGPTARNKRATRFGVVTSDARNKTIAVTISSSMQHPKYGKQMRRRSILHAHDEENTAQKGDRVEIVECRPMSKTKHWRLLRVLERAAKGGAS